MHFPVRLPAEKLKMLDITRDKPVKVAVKVAVPVRDHPKVSSWSWWRRRKMDGKAVNGG